MAEEYKYYAFISYNSKDSKWGQRLQRKLEHYRIPTALCRQRGWKRKPIEPVFYAPTDIQPGPLDDELKKRLFASRNLIVICSPNSANSQWVGKEIEYFSSLGRTKNIYFFIIKGEPNSANPDLECFHPIIRELDLPEILGVNINEKVHALPWLNKERAYIQLISKLLNVEFDSIWQRQKRLLFRRVISVIGIIICVLSVIIYAFSLEKTFGTNIKFEEDTVHNSYLPVKDIELELRIGEEVIDRKVSSLSESILIADIPNKFYGTKSNISVKSEGYIALDTIVVINDEIIIHLNRDKNIYGRIYFKLINNFSPVTNAEIMIEDTIVKSDSNGIVNLILPLDKQKKKYWISSKTIKFLEDSIEPPFTESSIVEVIN